MHYRLRGLAWLVVLGFPFTAGLSAQQGAGPDAKVSVVPGPDYAKAWLGRTVLGDGWRDLWTRPIRLPVADLTTLEGGLEPLRVGGGSTSATLHVQTEDGRRFVFRSVDKDPLTGMLEELAGTVFGATVRDQISAFHPWGALVVPPLLEAVGVLHAKPSLFVFPDGAAPDALADRFGGKVVLFEERPEDLDEGSATFGGFRRFSGTEAVLDRTLESLRHRVEVRALLKARLVDLIVGDRDRATGNWRWAREERDGLVMWHPIPRDRDQAFINLNGFAKRMASLWEPRLTRYDNPTPSVVGLSRNAWDLDRRFLPELDRPTWDSVTVEVVRALDDSVLAAAVAALPSEARSSRDVLLSAMTARRDRLPSLSLTLFELVNREATVWATHDSDSVQISYSERGDLHLDIFTRGQEGFPSRSHAFRAADTREVRLHLLDGDDRVIVEDGGGGPALRIIGGRGADSVTVGVTRSDVRVFDLGARTLVSGPGRSRLDRIEIPAPIYWGDTATGRDFGSRRAPSFAAGYASGLGPFLGLGLVRERYGLIRRPYQSRFRADVGYTLGRDRGFVRTDFRSGLGATAPWMVFRAGYSGIERLRFYGLGNETPNDRDSDVYRIPHHQVEVGVQLADTLHETITWSAGPILRATNTDTVSTATVLGELKPYGSGGFTQVGLMGELRRCPRVATTGLAFRRQRLRCSAPDLGSIWSARLTGAVWAPLGQAGFGEFAHLDGRLAFQIGLSSRVAVAARVGGRTTAGDAPFHHRAFLGGTGTLRGYEFDRFTGDHSAFANTELRIWFGTLRTPWFPMDVGALAMVDAGRVWFSAENSGRWHSSAGGGIWLAPFKREFAVHMVVAHGESTTYHFGPSFAF